MGLGASALRLELLDMEKNDLEYQAQQISQQRLLLTQESERIATEYQKATSNRQMKIDLFLHGDVDNTQTKKEQNLTYALLVSGTVTGLGTNESGITACREAKTSNFDYTSNNFYRLIDYSGAIVVSDKKEIPLDRYKTVAVTGADAGATQEAKVGDTTAAGIYVQTKTTGTAGDENIDKSYYLDLNQDMSGSNKIKEFYKGATSAQKNSMTVKYDPNSGIACVSYKNKESEDSVIKYYNMCDGSDATDANDKYNDSDAVDVKLLTSGSVPQSTKEQKDEVELKLGADGYYSLVDPKTNKIYGRYIVDETLKTGSSGEPNYLQDCLRNGKYLLQQATVDLGDDNKYKWHEVSWDGAANISDSYYADDDAAAKAKYDRLTAEIQAKDKQLEIQLDAIETRHKAIETERESVEKVENTNIEKTMKPFDA